jgi:hypothetical protein
MNGKMSNSARVFIISETPLLNGKLSSRLISTCELEFIGEEMDVEQGIHKVEVLKPDVVIWVESNTKRDPVGEITCLLTKVPGIKIFHMDLLSDHIVLYQSVQKVLKDLPDLLQAMETGY